MMMLAIDVDDLFSKEAFDKLTLEQKLSFKTLLKNVEGRSIHESISYIMSFMSSMPKSAPLSIGERELMLEAVAESLPESDKKVFKGILQMMQKLNPA